MPSVTFVGLKVSWESDISFRIAFNLCICESVNVSFWNNKTELTYKGGVHHCLLDMRLFRPLICLHTALTLHCLPCACRLAQWAPPLLACDQLLNVIHSSAILIINLNMQSVLSKVWFTLPKTPLIKPYFVHYIVKINKINAKKSWIKMFPSLNKYKLQYSATLM